MCENLPFLHINSAPPTPMKILVTLGPTQEPLDAMRILSNRSTGRLGTQLALSMARAGYQVIALRSSAATIEISNLAKADIEILPFTTAEDLRSTLEQLSKKTSVDAIFHVAAVSDFYFPEAGKGKIPTSAGTLTLRLEPTPKILPMLRNWFPSARITGWKFEASEIELSHDHHLSVAHAQMAISHTDACVINGPAIGSGFAYLDKKGGFHHFPDDISLCNFLTKLLRQ